MKHSPAGKKMLCAESDIPAGSPRLIHIGKKGFLVYRHDGQIVVAGHICSHGGEELTTGCVAEGEIVCPLHHARFSLRDGSVVSPPALDGIEIYESEVIDGTVHVGRPRSKDPPSVAHPSTEIASRPPARRRSAAGVQDRSESTVIIGAGAAGIHCAEALREAGYSGQVTVLCRESVPPYDRTILTKSAIRLDFDTATLPLRDPDYFELIGIDLRSGVSCERVDRKSGSVVTDASHRIAYTNLVIATGRRAADIPFAHSASDPVYCLRSADDASSIREALLKSGNADSEPPRVAIVGAGLLGLETASTIGESGAQVTIIAPETTPLAHITGERLASLILERHRAAGIEFRLEKRVKGFERSPNRLILSDQSEIPADVVIVATGSTPESRLLADAGLCRYGAPVHVDEHFRTADRRIFAVGDVASIPGAGGRSTCEHWITAARQGRMVGYRIAGKHLEGREIPFFWSEQHDLLIQAVGEIGVGRETVESGNGGILVIYSDGDSVVGAAGIGYQREIIEIEQVLRRRAESKMKSS